MAIVKMKKFSLLAFEDKKKTLLKELQKFQDIHFINLQKVEAQEVEFLKKDLEGREISEQEEALTKITFVLDHIRLYCEKQKGIKAIVNGKKSYTYDELSALSERYDWLRVYDEIKTSEEAINQLKSEKEKLSSEIELLTPWKSLEVSLKEIKSLNYCSYFIGSVLKASKDTFAKEINDKVFYSHLEVINENEHNIKVIIIYHKESINDIEDILKTYGFIKEDLRNEGVPLEVIIEHSIRIDEINKSENEMIRKIKNFASSLEELHICYEYISSKLERLKACENFLKTEKVVVIRGYVPRELSGDLEEIVSNLLKEDYFIEFEEPSEEDDVPVKLKNNAIVEPFESITSMYSLPKYSEIDPTPLLTPFYLLFFGMMLADVGYGLVIFLVSTLVLKYFNVDEGKKNFFKFFRLLSIPTAIVGAAYGSYFGDAIKIPGLIRPDKDIITILLLSMSLGVVQLYFGLGIKAYMYIRNKQYLDAIYDVLFWYAALTGSLILLISVKLTIPKGAASIAKYIMIVGMIGIILTQGRQNKGVGAKLGGGLYGLYGITGYIGDIVSYSRLMALGLAGGFIGGAFNLMIQLLGNGLTRWIFGTVIFVVGHIFNLLLGSLGAYVHTCRLQYVEYFSKFYEGGGKPFIPFKAKNYYINIKKN